MCLQTVTNTLKPNDEMMVGYKVFRKRANTCYNNLYFDVYKDHFMGVEYTAADLLHPHGYSTNGEKYETYYHIYDSLEEAQRYIDNPYHGPGSCLSLVVCEVIAWDIRAIGTQGKDDEICFIAKSYRLMREIER